MKNAPPISARIIKAAEFHEAIATPLTLRHDAEDIIRKAEVAAAHVQQLAANEREKLNNMLRTISDEELKKFLDVETVRNKAAVFAKTMDQIAAMKKEFDAIQPWLTRLVEVSIGRIIGTLEKDDLVARLVAQASDEIDPGNRNTLRAGSQAFFELGEARARYPEKFKGIAGIQNDSTLAADAIFLECSVGTTDISLDTQIGILLEYLAAQEQRPAAAQ